MQNDVYQHLTRFLYRKETQNIFVAICASDFWWMTSCTGGNVQIVANTSFDHYSSFVFVKSISFNRKFLSLSCEGQNTDISVAGP